MWRMGARHHRVDVRWRDVDVFKIGKSFEVQSVSVIEARSGHIPCALDYHVAATMMKQAGDCPPPEPAWMQKWLGT
jgi:hypothetical protein